MKYIKTYEEKSEVKPKIKYWYNGKSKKQSEEILFKW